MSRRPLAFQIFVDAGTSDEPEHADPPNASSLEAPVVQLA